MRESENAVRAAAIRADPPSHLFRASVRAAVETPGTAAAREVGTGNLAGVALAGSFAGGADEGADR